MGVIAPLINVFSNPYESWGTKSVTQEEMKEHYLHTGKLLNFIKTELKAKIENHFHAAVYMLREGVDNGLELHIDSHLDSSPEFQTALNHMPSKCSPSIEAYKQYYPNCDFNSVSTEINTLGVKLHEGQCLFHGGICHEDIGEVTLTKRPLSTSFCPQVALRNAEWMGKAYDEGAVHLFVLEAVKPVTNIYIFPTKGYLSNEKEVLFSSGARLKIKNKRLIRHDYPVCKIDSNLNEHRKLVPAYVVEMDIS